jgi:hypothetical protein
MNFKKDGLEGFRGSFALIWDDLNEKRGFGWKKNPWVYAVGFEVIENLSKLPVIEREGT